MRMLLHVMLRVSRRIFRVSRRVCQHCVRPPSLFQTSCGLCRPFYKAKTIVFGYIFVSSIAPLLQPVYSSFMVLPVVFLGYPSVAERELNIRGGDSISKQPMHEKMTSDRYKR